MFEIEAKAREKKQSCLGVVNANLLIRLCLWFILHGLLLFALLSRHRFVVIAFCTLFTVYFAAVKRKLFTLSNTTLYSMPHTKTQSERVKERENIQKIDVQLIADRSFVRCRAHLLKEETKMQTFLTS